MNGSRLTRLAGTAICLAGTTMALIGASQASALAATKPPAPPTALLSSTTTPTNKPPASVLPALPQFKGKNHHSLAMHRTVAHASRTCVWNEVEQKIYGPDLGYATPREWVIYSQSCSGCYPATRADCLGYSTGWKLFELWTFEKGANLHVYWLLNPYGVWYHWNGYAWVR